MAALVAASILTVAAAAAHGPPGLVLYVATNGSDGASGSSPNEAFATVEQAAAAVANASSSGLPAGGAEVRILPGTYAFNSTLTLGSEFSGTEASPIVFRGWGDGPAVFEGSVFLDATQLGPVKNATVAAIVNPAAKGKLLQMAVSPASIAAIVRLGTAPHSIVEGWSAESVALGTGSLQWDSELLQPSIWPNAGLAYVQRVLDKGAVWAAGRTKVSENSPFKAKFFKYKNDHFTKTGSGQT